MSPVTLFQDLRHAIDAAKAKGIHAESLGDRRATVGCPFCGQGQQILLEWDRGYVVGMCVRCGALPTDLAAEFAKPRLVETVPSPLPTDTTAASALRLYTPGELLEMPEPRWLVEPFIPEGGFVVLFGKPKTYKSFIAVDLAARAPGNTVYISAEGNPRRFGQRITTWENEAGRPSGILTRPFKIDLLGTGYTELRETLVARGPVSLIVVDTMARNTPGADENSTQDMGRLVGVIDDLRHEFECAVLLITHTGHEKTDRPRGSSALAGALDVSICATRTSKLEVRLSCAETRDFDEFETQVVRLIEVGGSLVAAQAVPRPEALEQDVAAYLDEHPDAGQNDVEKNVAGATDAKRAAYRKVRLLRRKGEAHPVQGAPKGGAPIEGAPQAQHPTLDPDEWKCALEDGGF